MHAPYHSSADVHTVGLIHNLLDVCTNLDSATLALLDLQVDYPAHFTLISWSQKWQPGTFLHKSVEMGFASSSIFSLGEQSDSISLFDPLSEDMVLVRIFLWHGDSAAWVQILHVTGHSVPHTCWLFLSPDPYQTLWYTDSTAPWPTRNLRPGKGCIQDMTLSWCQPLSPELHIGRSHWLVQSDAICHPSGSRCSYWTEQCFLAAIHFIVW